MKTALISAGLAAASSAFDPAEFVKGVQAGMFLVREEQYERFDCPQPTISKKAQSYIDWIEPMKEMMHTADGCKETNPSMDLFFVSFRSAVHLHYTFFGEY